MNSLKVTARQDCSAYNTDLPQHATTGNRRALLLLRCSECAAKAMIQCTRSLLCHEDESKMLRILCTLLVRIGGYRLCLVNLNQNGFTSSPSLSAWYSSTSIDTADLDILCNECRQSETATTTTTSHANLPLIICLRDSDDTNDEHFQNLINRLEIASFISIPLICGNEKLGFIDLFSQNIDQFEDPAEIEHLCTLANYIAYGLHTFQSLQELSEQPQANPLLKQHLLSDARTTTVHSHSKSILEVRHAPES